VSISTIDRRVVPAVDSVNTPWGQRLIPVGELERFMKEHVQRAAQRTVARPAGRPVSLPDSVLARIRLEYARGRSLGHIARALSADGVPTAHGGRQWWPSTVRAVLLRGMSRPSEAAGLLGPPLDGAPAPSGRAAELADRPGKTGSASEDVDPLRRDAKTLRNVDANHELGLGVDSHG